MTLRSYIARIIIASAMIGVSASYISAYGEIYIDPLFEYPSAPDDIDDLQTRSDYLMDHFWSNMDFSRKEAVNQTALNHAFQIYSSAIFYASRESALKSIDELTKKLKGNPTLMIQFVKAAEDCLYGKRAEVWSDEAYIPFLKAIIAEKTLPKSRKERYEYQFKLLGDNAIGNKFPSFRMTLRNGHHYDIKPSAPLSLIEIGNPECDDCRFAKMKLTMASDLEEMVENKQLDIFFIVADAVPEEQQEILESFSDYPENWKCGIVYGADDLLDLRRTPSFYILGKKGEIIAKNLDVTTAVEKIRILSEKVDKK